MSYNDKINRTGTTALMPEDVAAEIIQGAVEQSIVMQLARRLPNMSRSQRRLPVLNSLVSAYFVTGDTGFKQTSSQAWANKFVYADEMAVLVPIPETVLDDTDYDIWGEVKPRISEAFGQLFDKAVLFGTNKPADWPLGLITQAQNVATASSLPFNPSAAAATDLYEAILGTAGLQAAIEQVGFFPSAHIGDLSLRSKLRSVRDANGNPIFKSYNLDNPNKGVQGSTVYELDGAPLYFPRNGCMDATQALMFTGDWSQLVWALRTDVTYKILDQAVITDASNNIQINLAQQDAIALRATFRLGWQLPNPINRIQSDETKRLPFAVLLP